MDPWKGCAEILEYWMECSLTLPDRVPQRLRRSWPPRWPGIAEISKRLTEIEGAARKMQTVVNQ
jgi:hypothetical protein